MSLPEGQRFKPTTINQFLQGLPRVARDNLFTFLKFNDVHNLSLCCSRKNRRDIFNSYILRAEISWLFSSDWLVTITIKTKMNPEGLRVTLHTIQPAPGVTTKKMNINGVTTLMDATHPGRINVYSKCLDHWKQITRAYSQHLVETFNMRSISIQSSNYDPDELFFHLKLFSQPLEYLEISYPLQPFDPSFILPEQMLNLQMEANQTNKAPVVDTVPVALPHNRSNFGLLFESLQRLRKAFCVAPVQRRNTSARNQFLMERRALEDYASRVFNNTVIEKMLEYIEQNVQAEKVTLDFTCLDSKHSKEFYNYHFVDEEPGMTLKDFLNDSSYFDNRRTFRFPRRASYGFPSFFYEEE